MSLKAITWVLDNSKEKLGDRLVLIAIADYAHDDGGNAFAKVETYAQKAGLSERQTQRCLRRLEESGSIEKQGRHASGTLIYRVVMNGDILSPAGVTNRAARGDILTPDLVEELRSSDEDRMGDDEEPLPPIPVRSVGRVGPRDLLWEVFESEVGAVTNDAERKRRNAALKDVRQSLWAWLDEPGRLEALPNDGAGIAQACADELRRRCRIFHLLYDSAKLTEHAIANNWRTIDTVAGMRPTLADPFSCPECGRNGFVSTMDLREHRESEHGVAA